MQKQKGAPANHPLSDKDIKEKLKSRSASRVIFRSDAVTEWSGPTQAGAEEDNRIYAYG
jgi:hypothetical protein